MGIRKALHLSPRIVAPEPDVNHPHAFRAAASNWLGGGVPPSSQAGPGGTPYAISAVGLQFADRHCVICRREASNPIHEPAEE